jgi:acyl-coenzyme A thioesterase PaaI-like protein
MNSDTVDAQGGADLNKPGAGSDQQHKYVLQPNSRDCFVCGMGNARGLAMRFYSAGPGEVEARYTVDAVYQGYPGIVHGGIIAAMLDEVVGRVMMTDDPNRLFMTAKLELRFRSPVPIGQELRLHGELESQKGQMTFARGALFLPDGTLAVEAKAALVEWDGERADQEAFERLGWRVYEQTPTDDGPFAEVA